MILKLNRESNLTYIEACAIIKDVTDSKIVFTYIDDTFYLPDDKANYYLIKYPLHLSRVI